MVASKPSLICWKWPFSQNPENPNSTSCDDPWLFKSLKTLSSLAQSLLIADPPSASISAGAPPSRPSPAARLSPEAAEQRAFAVALSSGKEATLLEFYSPKCRLCNSLLDLVSELEWKNSDRLSFVLADAESDQWLPEILHYDIRYVPCFVLLDKQGRALAKTGVPTSRLHVIAGLHHLLRLKRAKREE